MSPATRAKYNIYTFNVTETLYESYAINKDEINLYSEENLLFSEENEYLLPLSLINYAYFTTDVFTMRGGLTLSLNNPLNNTINLDEKIVTKNNMNLSQSFNKDDLINYINTLPKSSLEYYCKETNHSKIIENSDYIFKIKIGDLSFTRNSNYAKSEAYNVEIIEEIKGKNNHSNEIIKIEFPMGQVEKDDIIYVGLFIGGHLVIDSGFFYLLSSSELLLESDFK